MGTTGTGTSGTTLASNTSPMTNKETQGVFSTSPWPIVAIVSSSTIAESTVCVGDIATG